LTCQSCCRKACQVSDHRSDIASRAELTLDDLTQHDVFDDITLADAKRFGPVYLTFFAGTAVTAQVVPAIVSIAP
jgi:hypothetical protein